MIAIVDYGVGNLFSLFSSLSTLGQDAVVTGDQRVLADAQKLILPGVGAFCDAARALRLTGLHDAVLREAAKGKPLLGICLGMQCIAIEFARNVLGYTDADSREMNEKTPHNVIDIMEEQKSITNMGGTMRLGAYECILQKGSKAYEAYGTEHIQERHRHRYEFNNQYKAEYEAAGMKCVGVNPESDLVEIVEIPKLKWFVGTQFHPEYSSTVLNPHPLFVAFIKASVESFEEKEKAKK